MIGSGDVPDGCAQDRRARQAAVERGIRAHNKMLVDWLTRKFGDRDLAKDLAQDAFVRLWRYAKENPVNDVKALLFKTAANLAANEFRSRARKRAHGMSSAPMEDWVEIVACDAPAADRTIEARQAAEASFRIIGQLPRNQRRAFVMNRFEGKNYEEIAEALEVSVSSVEKYMMAALNALRAVDRDCSNGGKVLSLREAKRRRAQ